MTKPISSQSRSSTAPCLDIVETPRLAHHRVQPRVINLIEGVQAFIAANAGRPIEATVEVA